MRLNAASTVCRRFHCAPLAALSAVTTATLTHLHAAAPLRVSEIRKRSSSLMARARHPSIGLRCKKSSICETGYGSCHLLFRSCGTTKRKMVKNNGPRLPLARGGGHRLTSLPVQSIETAHRDSPGLAPSSAQSPHRHTGRRISATQ
jgi:hypothetical protein